MSHFLKSIKSIKPKNSFIPLIVIAFMIVCLLGNHCNRIKDPASLDHPVLFEGTFSGVVLDSTGPVANAIVRVQTTDVSTTTDDLGRFTLSGQFNNTSMKLTAWAKGYFIGGGDGYPLGTTDIEITLTKHDEKDNPNYEWVSGYASTGDEGNCENCHAEPGNPSSHLPFDEWVRDAHAQSAVNPRFLTMYSGTDMGGNQSPLTRYGYSRDYGYFPLPPDLNSPYFGPGYKLDFPATEGNCAACHAPAAAVNDPYGTDPSIVTGVGQEGVACDFCHKVWDVRLNPNTGLPYDNMPGVLSFEYRRPSEGHQFFAGPLDDVAPGEDTYTPVQSESRYCAPCHSARFWGVEIYASFDEWLQSPYSDPNSGQTCQDCHMPKGLSDHFVRFDKGGLLRNPETLASHLMPGAMDETLLQNAVTMTVSGSIHNNEVVVDVEILNDKTGHHVPTDSPLRQMILLVRAYDGQSNALAQSNGPVLPDWCGVGDPIQGYYEGLPGRAYAKVLEETWTGVSPTGAYWNMTRIVSDNRLPAFGKDLSEYRFVAPSSGNATVEVQLIFRRAFIQLMEWKAWDAPDILMAAETLTFRKSIRCPSPP